MKLTPLDIHHKEFRNSLRGYSPEQVDDFLDEVADEFERLFKENIDLNEKITGLNERIKAYSELERTLQKTLVAAQTSADDIASRADAESAKIIKDAEAKAQEIVSSALAEKQKALADLGGVKAAESEFRARFQQMLMGYLETIPELEAAEESVADEIAAVAAMVAEDAPADQVDAEAVVKDATQPIETIDLSSTGTAVSLTLGEFVAPLLVDDEAPAMEAPEEFAVPVRASVGERDDDLDIEQID